MKQAPAENFPPPLEKTESGAVRADSLADLLEWFINYDPKVGLVRHPHVEELYQWKQADDAVRGTAPAPFDNAEARFAVGAFQAVSENRTQAELRTWITSVVRALGESKQINEEISKSYDLETASGASHLTEAEKIPAQTEKRIYLSSCWLEALCTAEARFLGWVYQELYGVPFQPDA